MTLRLGIEAATPVGSVAVARDATLLAEATLGLTTRHSELLLPAIDFVLRSAGVDTWVRDRPGASDHAPTWITLGPPRAARKPAARVAKATKATKATKANNDTKRAATKPAPVRKATPRAKPKRTA